MLKKMYLFVYEHMVGFVRVWLLLLIPCALSKHFASWMLTANVAMCMLMDCGQHKKWHLEDDNGPA